MLPDILIGVIAFVVALVIGIPVGILYRKKVAEKEIISAEEEAKRIINEAIKSAEGKKREALLEAKAAAAEDKTEIYNEDNSYRNELVDQALNDAVTQALSEDAQTVTRDVTLGLIYQDGAWWVVPDQALLQIISGVA